MGPCDMIVVAKDGIWVPKPYPEPRPLLVPGSRIDLAVRTYMYTTLPYSTTVSCALQLEDPCRCLPSFATDCMHT